MQTLPGGHSIEEIARKWHDLAQRRLEYYTELYRSGRWRHYYTEDRFAIRMLDVIAAARKWDALTGAPASQPSEDRSRHDDKMRPAA